MRFSLDSLPLAFRQFAVVDSYTDIFKKKPVGFRRAFFYVSSQFTGGDFVRYQGISGEQYSVAVVGYRCSQPLGRRSIGAATTSQQAPFNMN